MLLCMEREEGVEKPGMRGYNRKCLPQTLANKLKPIRGFSSRANGLPTGCFTSHFQLTAMRKNWRHGLRWTVQKEWCDKRPLHG